MRENSLYRQADIPNRKTLIRLQNERKQDIELKNQADYDKVLENLNLLPNNSSSK